MSRSELDGKLEAILTHHKYKQDIDTMTAIEQIKALFKEAQA